MRGFRYDCLDVSIPDSEHSKQVNLKSTVINSKLNAAEIHWRIFYSFSYFRSFLAFLLIYFFCFVLESKLVNF